MTNALFFSASCYIFLRLLLRILRITTNFLQAVTSRSSSIMVYGYLYEDWCQSFSLRPISFKERKIWWQRVVFFVTLIVSWISIGTAFYRYLWIVPIITIMCYYNHIQCLNLIYTIWYYLLDIIIELRISYGERCKLCLLMHKIFCNQY